MNEESKGEWKGEGERERSGSFSEEIPSKERIVCEEREEVHTVTR